MEKLEKNFQAKLIKRLKEDYPDSIVLKLDPTYKQGIPDLLILQDDKWAAFEVKRNSKSSKRTNQDYYISKMDNMSFARFINPENMEENLNDLRKSFKH